MLPLFLLTTAKKPDKPKKRRSRLNNELDRDGRATVFALERIKGKTIAEIAEEYNCHPSTVWQYQARARNRGLIVNYARHMIEDKLLPLTLAVYENHLTAGNLEAAQDILHGLGILQRNSVIKHETETETLESFRAKVIQRRTETALDGTIVPPPATTPLPDGALPANRLLEPAEAPYEPEFLPPGRLADLPDQGDEDE